MSDSLQTSLLAHSQYFNSSDPTVEIMGCCSHYRECSAAGDCVIPHDEISLSCAYRTNLENGKVFYGKTADGFDMERYESLVADYFALPKYARDELNAVLYYCCYRKGVNSALWYNTDGLQYISDYSDRKGLHERFVSLELDVESVINLYLDRYVKFIAGEMGSKNLNYKTKKEYIHAISTDPTDPFYKFIAIRFRTVSIPANRRMYLYELCRDHVTPSFDPRSLKIPRACEKGFLSAAEDDSIEIEQS